MMCRSHTFTESAPRWPAPVIDPRGFAPWKHDEDEFDREADEDADAPRFDEIDHMRARILSGKAVML